MVCVCYRSPSLAATGQDSSHNEAIRSGQAPNSSRKSIQKGYNNRTRLKKALFMSQSNQDSLSERLRPPPSPVPLPLPPPPLPPSTNRDPLRSCDAVYDNDLTRNKVILSIVSASSQKVPVNQSLTKSLLTMVLVILFVTNSADGCSSRSTPKPRPPSHSAMRPNITFQTYACPPAYAAWYCLNGATCFTVKIADSILYNCECADGYMGQRCEFKDLEGSYLPARERFLMLGPKSKVGSAFLGVLLIVLAAVIGSAVYTKSRTKAKRASVTAMANFESSHFDAIHPQVGSCAIAPTADQTQKQSLPWSFWNLSKSKDDVEDLEGSSHLANFHRGPSVFVQSISYSLAHKDRVQSSPIRHPCSQRHLAAEAETSEIHKQLEASQKTPSKKKNYNRQIHYSI